MEGLAVWRQAFLAGGAAARKQAFLEGAAAARGKPEARQREAFREEAPAVQQWQGVAAALVFQPAERAERDPRRWQGVAAAPVCPKGAAAA